MKQRAFCWAALIFWLLTACTFLSLRVEEWMTPLVTSTEILDYGGLSIDALALDETGRHVYLLVEGTGWESGTRVLELSENDYNIMEGGEGIHVKAAYSDTCVLFSSKPLVSGETAQVLAQQHEAPDLWLAVDPPELFPWEEMPEGAEAIAAGEGAALVRVQKGKHPFLPAQGKKALNLPRGTGELYSMGDFSSLCGQLPRLGLLAGILLSALLLWAYSLCSMKKLRKNPRLLLLNTGAFLGLLPAFSLVMERTALPSSLLPGEGILDLSFYAQQFPAILSSLENFATAGSSEAQELLKSAGTGCAAFFACMGACVLAVCGLMAFEVVWMRGRRE